MNSLQKKRTNRRKLSPTQWLKGTIIRYGFAKKIKNRQNNNKVEFRLIWSRVILLFVSLALVGWLSLGTFGYYYLKNARNFPETKYTDVLFPWRWDDMRIARGDYYIAQAKKIFQGDLDEGNPLHLLRVGVSQSPDNTEGRILLAQVYSMIGRPDLAATMLGRKVDDHLDNEEYLSTYISLLFNAHEDEKVDALATRVLAGESEPTPRNLLLAIAGGTANFNRGNYDRAQEFIDRFNLTQSRPGMLLQARLDWEQGQRMLAISQMERVVEGRGQTQEEAFNFLIQYLWEDGQESRALQTALLRYAEDPMNFRPRLRLIYIYNMMDDAERVEREAGDFMRFFGNEEPAMNGLIDFAGRQGQPELAERIHRHMRERGMRLEEASVRLVEAHVVANQFDRALEWHNQLSMEDEALSPVSRGRLKAVLTVAHLGSGHEERGENRLRETLDASRDGMAPSDLLVLSERLRNIGRVSEARDILIHIYQNNPLNQEALAHLVRLDLDSGRNQDLVANLNRLMATRKPPLSLLESARTHISSDLFLFERNRSQILESLDSTIEQGRRLATRDS